MQAKKIIFLAIIFTFSKNAIANDLLLIRDAETEEFLHQLADPFFNISGLDPQDLQINIVQDSSINAFVVDSKNMFINTGLITQFNNSEALLGVIAHEIGHMLGKHIAKTNSHQQNIQQKALLGYGAAIGAAISGSADAATAIILATQHSSQRISLKYSRQQEQLADDVAINLLQKLHYPISGMEQIFSFFAKNQAQDSDEYQQSHPLSANRLENIKSKNVKYTIHYAKIINFDAKLQTIQAKLDGFLESPKIVLNKYNKENNINHQIARAIAYFRLNDYRKSLQLLDSAINHTKNNGFLYELKAEILQYIGNNQQAIANYQTAIKNLSIKQSCLARLALANLVIASEDEKLIDYAQKNMLEAKKYLQHDPLFFKNLAWFYNNNKQTAIANFYLGKYYLMINNKEAAKKFWDLVLEQDPNLDLPFKQQIKDNDFSY